jgi:hypothetical protein
MPKNIQKLHKKIAQEYPNFILINLSNKKAQNEEKYR